MLQSSQVLPDIVKKIQLLIIPIEGNKYLNSANVSSLIDYSLEIHMNSYLHVKSHINFTQNVTRYLPGFIFP